MADRIYLVEAYTVAEYRQSDELYLMKLADGRIVGYSEEFQYATSEIKKASYLENCHVEDWFGLSSGDRENWEPATLAEIQSLNLQELLIGWKSTFDVEEAITSL